MGHKVISLTDYYDSEMVSRNSPDEGDSPFDSFKSLLSEVNGEEYLLEVPMPPSVTR